MVDNIEKKAYFAKRRTELENEAAGYDKRYNGISAIRAVVFLIALVCLIIGLKDSIPALTIVGICLAIAFLVLVKKHEKLAKKQEQKKAELKVVDRYVKRFEGGWRDFEDDGSEFLKKEDTVPVDIDLLGKASLYQLTNVAHTEGGRSRFANALRLLPEITKEELKLRNEAVSELCEKLEFSVDFEALSQELADHCRRKKSFDLDGFINFCKDDTKGDMPVWAKAMRLLLPAVVIILLLLGIIGVISIGPAIVMFFVTLFFSWITKSVTDYVIAPFYNISFAIGDYMKMMELMAGTEFESKRLNELKDIYQGSKGILAAFSKLNTICQAYNIVFNPLMHQLLSGLFLWDYQLAAFTAQWKKKYGKLVGEAFDGIYEMEFLLSLSVLPKIRNTSFADIETEVSEHCASSDLQLSADKLYHPLISTENVVANDARLGSGITIITGSNMSGKTTFLRTIAINLALAYLGAPVCAEGFFAQYMKLFTSMRVTDDVANGISTFYAEILRIKAMAEYKEKNGGPMLCMIDEIFKGTNSADRIVGAKEAITRLAGQASMVVVSTHDFELCSVENPDKTPAVNYHFEEYYEGEKLMFDYKIRAGRCTTTNARAILKMAGFLS
jgi:hypothetical protein